MNARKPSNARPMNPTETVHPKTLAETVAKTKSILWNVHMADEALRPIRPCKFSHFDTDHVYNWSNDIFLDPLRGGVAAWGVLISEGHGRV